MDAHSIEGFYRRWRPGSNWPYDLDYAENEMR
jgi:hypothetical protein